MHQNLNRQVCGDERLSLMRALIWDLFLNRLNRRRRAALIRRYCMHHEDVLIFSITRSSPSPLLSSETTSAFVSARVVGRSLTL